MPLHAPGATRLAWRPCGDLNAGICLRRAALYPLSYRGFLDRILTQPKWGDKTWKVISTQGVLSAVKPRSLMGFERQSRQAETPAVVQSDEMRAPHRGFKTGVVLRSRMGL